MKEFKHYTVMLNEAVDALNCESGKVYVDCTLGGGGHSGLILSKIQPDGRLISFDVDDDAIEAANDIASEHLEIITKNPFETMTKIKNAGAIFLGEYSSEPLGDYFAGPNHVLPTNGTAKFFSPLSVDDFIKKSSVINFSYDALKAVHEKIEMFAENEGLYAHANSIKVRFENE